MQLLDLTLPSPAENLALDEALLDAAEAGDAGEVLRLWESPRQLVVVGRSSRLDEEVDVAYCRAEEIPVLRRCSGGAAVVAGPGCLMYAAVLSYARQPALRAVDRAHREVLGRIAAVLAPLAPQVRCAGTSDLVLATDGQANGPELAALKISGNSVRCKRSHFLYHGTLLYDFPLEMIAKCLTMPPRQPDYRRRRPHARFVTNIPLAAATLRRALATAFAAAEPATAWPRARTAELVACRYGTADWNA